MAEIVGIRFKRAGKVYYFNPADVDVAVGDYVIIKTGRGLELGYVVIGRRELPDSGITEPLREVVRKAELEDIEHAQELEHKSEEALIECGKLVNELNLPMKLLLAEYNLDGSRLTFLFSAEERVDFRELVHRLTGLFKAKIELRQVGSRDEAKLLGSFGKCGRPLCCTTFLSEFTPVSIKMAKEQELPLNPVKISGACGRLMCCLAYEHEQYQAVKARMPKVGKQVSTPMGEATVVGTNSLKETVLVELEGGVRAELPLDDIS